jgi:hypothetical protein
MELLTERAKTHGDFRTQSMRSQQLKGVIRGSENWAELSNAQREALEMIASKLARILVGDPNVKDHWDDVAGYALLAGENIAFMLASGVSVGEVVHTAMSQPPKLKPLGADGERIDDNYGNRGIGMKIDAKLDAATGNIMGGGEWSGSKSATGGSGDPFPDKGKHYHRWPYETKPRAGS